MRPTSRGYARPNESASVTNDDVTNMNVGGNMDSLADREARERSRARRGAGLWVLVCGAALLWWAVNYRFLFERFGEWQFARLGRYYPTLTMIAFMLLFTVPIGIVIWWRTRRRYRHEERSAGSDDHADRALARVRLASDRYRLFFAASAIIAAVLAIGVGWTAWTMPDARGDLTIIRAGSPDLTEGPARFEGGWRTGRVARFEENLGVARRTIFVAPVYLNGQANRAARFVTTVEPVAGGRYASDDSGILIRNGVPSELKALYREAGVALESDSYMLMRDEAQVRWRGWALAGQLAVLALLAAAAWLMFRRQAKRLGQRRTTQVAPDPATV